MKEFTKVCNFSYCNIPYAMFIDNKDRYFFMRRDNNDNYYYTTYEEQKKLLTVFYRNRKILNIKMGDKLQTVPKVISGTLAMVMALSMFPGCAKGENVVVKDSSTSQEYNYYYENPYEDKFDFDMDEFVIEDDDFKIDTYREIPGAGDRVMVHDSAYLDDILGTHQATEEEFNNLIDSNSNIPEKYKQLIKDYCHNYITYMPNADRRILYHNLETLKFISVDKMGLILSTFDSASAACYYPVDNSITVLDEYEFKKGTWEYQILFHELSHVARHAMFNQNGKNYEIQSGGYSYNNIILDETLNTLFSIKLLGYDEKDFAYQLQSNYLYAIIESMDNYDLSDYINHSQSYFIAKLNEYIGQKGRSNPIFELIQMQFDDYHDEYISVEQSEYYPIYEFVLDVYCKNRITSGMSYEEAENIKKDLLDIILFDVPEGYQIDTNHIDQCFDNYCINNGIEINKKSL